MQHIIRPKYIKQITQFVDKPVIKVLTGMRRVGKSTLLTMIKDEILKNIPDNNKIYLNFESAELFDIATAKALHTYLQPLIKKTKGKIYFFFDEIQMVSGWERVVNGLSVDKDCDIYITGSNSTLISGDLTTLLSGRYTAFEIYPFTFGEFMQIFKNKKIPKETLFEKFVQLGGMPFLHYFDLDEVPSFKYLNDVYNTVLVKDVLQYNNIRDVDIFNRILSYVLENIGHTFSANSIKNYFKNEKRAVSIDTVLNYLEYCKNAFIIKKVSRYDIAGKKLLKVDEKYYVTDHGFRQAQGFSNTKDIERTLENIVFIELASRGYEVKIGKLKDREIDFIAQKNDRIFYYQVAYMLTDEKTREREFGVYKSIEDNFPKYVLSMDHFDFSRDGVIHKNIIDFLLETVS
ncbi:ATP-binding protein [Treponema vincentii]|uniref:ATP-binding protein n=1 Tax=Treponema vincentii TaxID=69710 RepID=UPI0020A2BAE3|nr:ATP-binding protein [Treponema vincentii]UTC59769.1 ATP-binding protein [Treponema vincentii]